jgi:DNA modification methylase
MREEGKRELPRPTRAGVRTKTLMLIPARLALALSDAGWRVRQDVIWHKPNPMPESVRDRCTKAHEYLYLFSKQEIYQWDWHAMQEPASTKTHPRLAKGKLVPAGWDTGPGNHKALDGNYAKKARRHTPAGPKTHSNEWNSRNNSSMATAMSLAVLEKRNRRSVWTIPVAPFKGAHFATFPPALIEPCILASTKPGDLILDPFGGAGTTGLVADKHGRNALLIELRKDYAEMAYHRLTDAGEPLLRPITIRRA